MRKQIMKATMSFNECIKEHLEQVAATDAMFAQKYANPQKSLTDCVTYILNWVKDSGCNGFSEAEIFGQAMHYYDEENIKVGKPINCRVVVNRSQGGAAPTQQTEAKQQEANDAYEAYKAKHVRKQAAKRETIALPSLFD